MFDHGAIANLNQNDTYRFFKRDRYQNENSEFILKYLIESYPTIQDCINAVVLQMPCDLNLIEIIEKDMKMINRDNIE